VFSHEKLIVYQKAISFAAWTQPLLESLSARTSARDQLDRASTSVPLNIAEGNMKFSVADRARYLQTAVGSATECAACLDVLVARGLCDVRTANEGKMQLETIVGMVMGMLSKLGYRFDDSLENLVREEPGEEG
jgi:four helix bundle protein